MLRKETVAHEIIKLIKELQSSDILKNFALAGGTALSLQLGHRESVDIDLFSANSNNYENIFNYLNNKFEVTEVIYRDDHTVQLIANKIKIDLVDIKGVVLETPIEEEGIKLFDIKDISAMKLLAIQGRKKAKDYADIAYMIEEIGLELMIDNYKKKYGKDSSLDVRKALIGVDLVNPYEWEKIKMIRTEISLSMVNRVIKNALIDYEKKHSEILEKESFLKKIFKRRK